ncbi:unnamed protein product [Lepidochelys kempii]
MVPTGRLKFGQWKPLAVPLESHTQLRGLFPLAYCGPILVPCGPEGKAQPSPLLLQRVTWQQNQHGSARQGHGNSHHGADTAWLDPAGMRGRRSYSTDNPTPQRSSYLSPSPQGSAQRSR